MKYYKELVDKGCFTFNDVVLMVGGNHNTAKSLLRQYAQKGYIQQIKKNLYVAINFALGGPSVSKFHIASNITPSSYVSHCSAFEYYGYANQVTHEINVSSESTFSNFEYDYIDYKYVKSRLSEGIVEKFGVRVTDRERTTIDCINDFEHIGGLEEVLREIDMITFLSEDKLLHYLSLYNKAVLYQKVGYVLEHFKDDFYLSDAFFEECIKRKGKSVRYFENLGLHRDSYYNAKWGLVVPNDLLYIIEGDGWNIDC